MSYVDAFYSRKRDKMYVVERKNGQRDIVETQVEHVLYYTHPTGQHQSIFGEACKKFSTYDSRKIMAKKKELASQKHPPKIMESDIRPEFRHLAKHYMGVAAPVLNVGFFDIETDFDPETGFSSTDDASCAVTAISVYLSHEQRLVTMALVPPTLSFAEGEAIGNKFENTLIFDDEAALLEYFFDVIEDIDVLSGWNSTGYDIPYMVNRVRRMLGEKALARFCLNGERPRPREFMKFGKLMHSYDLVGRVHLDYLELYQKHNPQQQQSYRLDYIGEQEVGDNKIPYEGTLDALYKDDFYRFIEYNRQDVSLLVKIDAKRKFIELANQIAHTNCVLLKTTVGSVALVEAAIINEMHAMGFVVPDRKPREEDGSFVKAAPRTRMARTQVVREIDPLMMEEALSSYTDALTDEETQNLVLALTKLNDGEDIEDTDTFYSLLSEHLRETAPEVYAYLERESTLETVETIDDDPLDDDDENDVKMSKDGRTPVVGAYVAKPKKGIHREIACIDINSLYPSCIRALNMSPETIFGQVRPTRTMALVEKRISEKVPRAEAWDGIFCLLEVTAMHEQTDELVVVDFEDGRTVQMTGAQLHDLIYKPSNNLCISANGTIFTTAKDGIIPMLLAKWYTQRQDQQALERMYAEMAGGIEIDDELMALLSE